jgi:hypothetical protein
VLGRHSNASDEIKGVVGEGEFCFTNYSIFSEGGVIPVSRQ